MIAETDPAVRLTAKQLFHNCHLYTLLSFFCYLYYFCQLHYNRKLKTPPYIFENGMFLYESVPGTSVRNYVEKENGVEFQVEGDEDAQITIGLDEETEYEVFVDGVGIGTMTTGLGGKLSLSVELETAGEVSVRIEARR